MEMSKKGVNSGIHVETVEARIGINKGHVQVTRVQIERSTRNYSWLDQRP